ncbi:NACHT domain-containing protein [Nocardia sp. NPDC004711]
MPDYDIDRLGDRAFEQLIVSLAVRVLGAGVQAFGDGPDGGREATFEGPINWSNTSDGPSGVWDGFTVFQAKFRYHPSSVKENAAWLKSQIKGELDRWTTAMDNGTRLRAPDYIIFVSNVRLSPKGVSGGIDTLETYFRSLISDKTTRLGRLGIIDFKIWHADQIHRFLDATESVRHAFPALLTVGDVLGRIGDHVSGSQIPALAQRMRLHAAQCIRNERWIRLSEAGARTGQKSKIEDVGIDLPGIWYSDDGINRSTRITPIDCTVVTEIISRSDAVLKRDIEDSIPRPHWVIIGGPGQGKSTLSAMIAQIYRAELLARGAMTPDVEHIVNQTRLALERTGIPAPRNLRWPMRIDLSRYAEILVATPEKSLLAHLAGEISNRTDAPLTPNDLQSWLRAWPWVVILDGLDEVSESSLRRTLIERVTDLMETADSLHADLLLVATTRPLGYDEQFDRDLFSEIRLTRLPPSLAKSFGAALVAKRLADDPDLRDTVTERLKNAVDDRRVGQLMSTPLQVAIMSFIVENFGTLPNDRYELFSDYYKTVYQRELEKRSSISRLLREHRSDISHLHMQVALQLHVNAEVTRFSAAMPLDELENLVRTRLARQRYTAREIDGIATNLVVAATHRLVLLVPDRNKVRFEVRSLQELMAADALTSGTESRSMQILEACAHHPHWRNVWLLAAGKLYKREHLQERLADVVSRSYTESNPLFKIAPSSPSLACGVMDDGFASQSPLSRRRYLDIVLDGLSRHMGFSYLPVAYSMVHSCQTSEETQYLFEALSAALDRGELEMMNAVRILAAIITRIPNHSDRASKLLPRTRPKFNSLGLTRMDSVKLVLNQHGDVLTEQESTHLSRRSLQTTRAEVEVLLTLLNHFLSQQSETLTHEQVERFRLALDEINAWGSREHLSDTRKYDYNSLGLATAEIVGMVDNIDLNLSELILEILRPLIARQPVGEKILRIILGPDPLEIA